MCIIYDLRNYDRFIEVLARRSMKKTIPVVTLRWLAESDVANTKFVIMRNMFKMGVVT